MNNFNIFNINIRLSVLYKSDKILIIFKNHDNFKIRVIKIKKLIKKFF